MTADSSACVLAFRFVIPVFYVRGMDMDIDLDEFDGLVEGIDAAEPAVRAAAAGRLEVIYENALRAAWRCPPTGVDQRPAAGSAAPTRPASRGYPHRPDHQHHPRAAPHPQRPGPHRTRPLPTLPLPRLLGTGRPLRPRPRHHDGDSADNLHCLCRRHHRITHQTGWHVTIGDNELEWTSPAGRTYRTKPPNTRDYAA